MLPLTTAAFLLLLVFSGCLGGGDDDLSPTDADAETNGSGGGPVPEDGRRSFLYDLEEPKEAVVWGNGSFEAQETGMMGGFIMGTYQEYVDVTDLVPAGVPAEIEMEVTADAGEIPEFGTSFAAWVQSNGVLWYSGTMQQEPGSVVQTATVLRIDDGTIGIALEAYAPDFQDDLTVEYSYRFAVKYDPIKIHPGMPVALELEANETVGLEPLDDSKVDVLVYDPEDVFVTRLQGQDLQEWEAGAPGAYVLALTWESAAIGVHGSQGENGTFEPLFFEWEFGPVQELESQSSTAWQFELPDRPLRVGVFFEDGEEPWFANGEVDVTVTSPAGTVIDGSGSCGLCMWNPMFGTGFQWAWFTPRGDDGLSPGGYEVNVESELLLNFQAFHVVERYSR